MPTNPFVILGIEKGASQSEILEAYNAKRAYYQAHIFDEGKEGAEAAKMLTLLEDAYQQAIEQTHEQSYVSGQGESTFEAVKAAIRSKQPDLAQSELDKITYRGAEWHYFQSVVFYEKNWLNDSKTQLELALAMDPGNSKYTEALEKLKKKTNGSRPYDQQGSQGVYANNGGGQTATNRSYSQGGSYDDGCCAACEALWCADCCCECMGGDLIRCC